MMDFYMARQTMAFLYACLLGAFLGAVYDLFRILRLAFLSGKAVVFLEDMVFFLFSAAATFLFLLTENDGVLRAFLLTGEVIGAVLYFLTLGRLVMRAARPVIRTAKGALAFVSGHILWPIWRLIYRIVSLFLAPVRFLWRIIKKTLQIIRFRLKTVRLVLYNHSIGYAGRIMHQRRLRENRLNGAEEDS